MPELFICIPTYNEKENLERLIQAIDQQRPEISADVNVLVIDDNSPDGTGEIADRLSSAHEWVHVLHRTAKEGLGRAYLAGFQTALDAGADLIMEMDCDFSHNPSDIKRMVAASDKADLILGSRGVKGGGVEGWPLHRIIISRGGSFYARTILGLKVRDLTGGFKLFHRRVLEALSFEDVEAHGYTFQIELTYRALQKGFTVHEIPIIFVDREFGESKMTGSIVREAMINVWKLRFAKR